jgi:hypothetical protein
MPHVQRSVSTTRFSTQVLGVYLIEITGLTASRSTGYSEAPRRAHSLTSRARHCRGDRAVTSEDIRVEASDVVGGEASCWRQGSRSGSVVQGECL